MRRLHNGLAAAVAVAPQVAPRVAPRVATVAKRCMIGPFRLDTRADILMHGQVSVALGRRAIALLTLLIEHPGEVVTKDEIIEGVWKGIAVEEGNIAAQVNALRRALATEPGGAAWIETLPRRGYRFRGPVHWEAGDPDIPPAPAGRPTLAVLRFRSLPPDPVPSYIADGLAEDVISALSGLDAIVVISRNSTFRLTDPPPDLAQLGRDLGARYVFSATLRRNADRIRINGELAEAETGAILTARAFETQAGLLFDAQDEIVADIVRTLAPRVRDEELRRIATKRPEDFTAHELALQARALIHRLDRTAFDQAEALLHRAAALAPRHAEPWTLLAELHSLRIAQGWARDRAAEGQQVERCVLAAIDRDPHDAHALARYGYNRALLHRDYGIATAMLDRAIQARPGSALVWRFSGATQAFLGHGEAAVQQAEHAMRLSPRDWYGYRLHSTLCLAHYTSGSYDEAARSGMAALAENPRDISNMQYTIASLVAAREHDRARALTGQRLTMDPPASVARTVARHPYADPARREEYGNRLRQAGLPD